MQILAAIDFGTSMPGRRTALSVGSEPEVRLTALGAITLAVGAGRRRGLLDRRRARLGGRGLRDHRRGRGRRGRGAGRASTGIDGDGSRGARRASAGVDGTAGQRRATADLALALDALLLLGRG